uniref:Hsp90 chaperone protein kinase-targeting subunit n=1 Tax=Blastobotrys adeninivorans TaxID=409370 RepID=A0A060T4U2_BLAAD
MVVDYSKWDKLELSDDSDVEVHPNVDKKSFIRWKQRDIHVKREQLKENIRQLEISTEMNADLLDRIDQLIKIGEKGEEKVSDSIQQAVQLANRGFTKTKPTMELRESDNVHEYSDMIENLMEQIQDEIKGQEGDKEALTVGKLKYHRNKLDGILKDQHKQLEELREERSRHIVSEDLRTGFDSTIVNKQKSATEAAPASKGKEKQKETSIEVLNSGAPQGEIQGQSKNEEEENDDVNASDAAKEFAKIPVGEYHKAYSYLQSHPKIINEKEKDGLMMEAFQMQLDGDTKSMERTVHNALLLQYCYTLGPDGLTRFFSKVTNKDHPAHNAFLQDVEFTANHIKERCRVLAQERADEAEPVEQIQLHSVDPNTEIVVNVPDESQGEEALKVFNSFSPAMKKAIESKKLDEINKVLGNMTVEDAEEAVKKLDECGALMVEEKIYDATEWQKEHGKVGEEIDAREVIEQAQGHVQGSTYTPTVDDVD